MIPDSINRFWYLERKTEAQPPERRVPLLESMIRGALESMCSPEFMREHSGEADLKDRIDHAVRMLIGRESPPWHRFDEERGEFEKLRREFERIRAASEQRWRELNPWLEKAQRVKDAEARATALEKELREERIAAERLRKQVNALRKELETDKWLAGR